MFSTGVRWTLLLCFSSLLLLNFNYAQAQSVAGMTIGLDLPAGEVQDFGYKAGVSISLTSAFQIERYPRVPLYVLAAVGMHFQTPRRGSAEILHTDGLYYDADLSAIQNAFEISLGTRFLPLHKSYKWQPFADFYLGTFFLFSRQRYSFVPDGAEESTGGGKRLERSWEMGPGKALGLMYNAEEAAFTLRISHQRLSPGRMVNFRELEFTGPKSSEYPTPLLRQEWLGIELGLMFFI